MKLWNIAKDIGVGLIKEVVPGGGLLIKAINAVLPDGMDLPDDATGDDINHIVSSLPPEQQAQIMNKEFDVEMTQIKESNETVRVMLESDVKNPHSTRPYIAKHSFHVVAFTDLLAISIWAWAVITSENPLKNLTEGWPFILAVTGTLTTLLLAYFGILKQEHKNKLDAAAGAPQPSGLAGLISSFIKR